MRKIIRDWVLHYISYYNTTIFFVCMIFTGIHSYGQIHVSVLAGANNNRINIRKYHYGEIIYPYRGTTRLATGNTDYQINSRFSYFAGLKIDVDLTNSITLSSKLLLDNLRYVHHVTKVFKVDDPSSPITDSINGKDIISLLYFNIPLHLVFYASLRKTRIYVGAGGYFAYGLWGTNEFRSSYSTIPEIVDSIAQITFSNNKKIKYALFHANRIDLGLSVITGIEFRNHFFIEAGYEGGLKSIFKDRYVGVTSYHYPNNKMGLRLGVGYKIK